MIDAPVGRLSDRESLAHRTAGCSVGPAAAEARADRPATFRPCRASNEQLDIDPAWRPAMNFVTRCAMTLGFAFSAVVMGDSAHAAADISKVNGSVRVEAGQQVGDVDTVNGSVTIGAGAHAGAVETVNGSLKVEDRAVVESAETVNGSVTLGLEAEVQQGVETVNGSLTLRQGARVHGKLENVNGTMLLEGAEVGGGIETVNGDIRLATGTHVAGGIHVDKNTSMWSWGSDKRKPKITVEQGATVEGRLYFEREVDLYVAPGVVLPAIEGVQPQRFTLQ
jgi:hypothetical protein